MLPLTFAFVRLPLPALAGSHHRYFHRDLPGYFLQLEECRYILSILGSLLTRSKSQTLAGPSADLATPQRNLAPPGGQLATAKDMA